jgi:hypothetical protein
MASALTKGPTRTSASIDAATPIAATRSMKRVLVGAGDDSSRSRSARA